MKGAPIQQNGKPGNAPNGASNTAKPAPKLNIASTANKPGSPPTKASSPGNQHQGKQLIEYYSILIRKFEYLNEFVFLEMTAI